MSSGEGENESEADFKAFVDGLPDGDARWAVYDLNFMKNGVNNSKIVSLLWVPEGTDSRMKFAYANSKAKFNDNLKIANKSLRLSDKDDITRAKFIDEF